MNIDEVLARIKSLKKVSFETSELYELGLTKYYLKKYTDNKTFKKVGIGHYELVKNKEIAYDAFYKFKQLVLSDHYEEALEQLKINIKYRETHDFDTSIFLFVKFLKKILGSAVDEDELLKDVEYKIESSEQIDSEQYNYFIKFCDCVLKGNFNNAYFYLSKYDNIRKLKDNGKKIFTTMHIYFHLLTAIYNKEKENLSYGDRKNNYFEHCKIVHDSIFNFDYDTAIEHIDILKDYAYMVAYEKLLEIKEMILTYFDMVKNKNVLTPGVYDQNHYPHLLYDMAIKNKDYLTAYQNVSDYIEFVENKSQRYFLILARAVLKQINHQNQINIELQRKNNRLLWTDLNQLQALVRDGNLKQVNKILEEYDLENKRLEQYLKKLLSVIDKLKSSRGLIYKDKKADMDFFASLDQENYKHAYELITTSLGNDDIEFTIYKMLLSEIVNLLDKNVRIYQNYEDILVIDKKLDYYLYKYGSYTEEELDRMASLIAEKRQIQYEIDENKDLLKEEIYILNLIDTIKSFNNSYGNFEDFFEKQTYSDDLVSCFHQAMSFGDYNTALTVISNPSWDKLMINKKNYKYYKVIRRLLWRLHDCVILETTEEPVSVEDNDVDLLTELRRYIKKRDYLGAYKYYMENTFDFDEKAKIEIGSQLAFLKAYDERELLELKNNFINRCQNGDYDSAKKVLDDYSALIDGKNSSIDLAYYYKFLTLEQIRINKPYFVKLEKLYDLARYQFTQGEIEKCVATLDEYISLDDDLSSKGYLLRGRAYELLSDKEKAKADYKKAYEVFLDPSAYYYLNKLEGNPDFASQPLNDFEKSFKSIVLK